MAGRYVDIAVKVAAPVVMEGVYVREGETVQAAAGREIKGQSVIDIMRDYGGKTPSIVDVMELQPSTHTAQLNASCPEGDADEEAAIAEEEAEAGDPTPNPHGTGFLS